MDNPTIEQVLLEHDYARRDLLAAVKKLAAAQQRMDKAHELLMAIHPGNPTSPYAPERTKEAIAAAFTPPGHTDEG
jgi:capsule polysaccharide export protein KpsE/RkpR